MLTGYAKNAANAAKQLDLKDTNGEDALGGHIPSINKVS